MQFCCSCWVPIKCQWTITSMYEISALHEVESFLYISNRSKHLHVKYNCNFLLVMAWSFHWLLCHICSFCKLYIRILHRSFLWFHHAKKKTRLKVNTHENSGTKVCFMVKLGGWYSEKLERIEEIEDDMFSLRVYYNITFRILLNWFYLEPFLIKGSLRVHPEKQLLLV